MTAHAGLLRRDGEGGTRRRRNDPTVRPPRRAGRSGGRTTCSRSSISLLARPGRIAAFLRSGESLLKTHASPGAAGANFLPRLALDLCAAVLHPRIRATSPRTGWSLANRSEGRPQRKTRLAVSGDRVERWRVRPKGVQVRRHPQQRQPKGGGVSIHPRRCGRPPATPIALDYTSHLVSATGRNASASTRRSRSQGPRMKAQQRPQDLGNTLPVRGTQTAAGERLGSAWESSLCPSREHEGSPG